MKKGCTRLIVSIFCSFLGLALLILINCGGGDGDDGNISSPYPNIDEIAGSYSLRATLTSASAPCGAASSYNNPAIEISTNGNDVTVHSTVPITGVYNSSDGSYSGSAGLLAIVEGINGIFRKSGSTITLSGNQHYHQLYCDISYDVIYTKK